MASTNLSKTPSSAGNRKKFNFSFWLKGNDFVSDYIFFSPSGSSESTILFDSSSRLEYYEYNGSSKTTQITTNRKFRDPSAWMHINISIDTTQSTSSNRVKIYVNGSQETDLANSTYPALNFDSLFNNTTAQYIGSNAGGGNFDGSMTHIHFNDGYTYDASSYGESDSVSGIWKPKTSPSVTYGSNGFFLKFENSGAMGTDSSGNSNTYAVGGTLTQNVDTPSNNFATWNPLIPQGLAYANGNLSATHNAASWKSAYGTLAMSGTGKYYFESKVSTLGSFQGVGIVDAEQISSSASKFGAVSRGYGYKNDGNKTNNDVDASYGATYTTGDIIMCAVDLNAGAIWWGKNGTWQNSATQSEIEAGTTTNAGYTGISNSYVYLPAVQIYGSGTNQLNTGSGYFGTTSVVTANADDGGLGIMEYDVPANYRVLCTKNIKDYG